MIAITNKGHWQLDGIDAILFDKDGTLIDSHVYWGEVIKRRARKIIYCLGLKNRMYEMLCNVMGFSLEESRLRPEGPIALVGRDEVISIVCRFLESCGRPTSFEYISRVFLEVHAAFLPEINDYIHLIPGTISFLDALRDVGTKAAVVTSDSVANTIEALKRLGIESYFNLVVGKESVPEPKVTGVPALRAMKELGVAPAGTVCLGDAPVDMIMADKSGCKAGVGIASGQSSENVLANYTPYVSSSLSELRILELTS